MMKLRIEKRSEVLSTGTQGLVLKAILVSPGACSTCSGCCTSTTCGMTATMPISVEKA